MPPLEVAGTVPILIVGRAQQVDGEVWLANPTGADIAISGATITITLPSGVESGPIQLPPDARVPAQTSRRLAISMGMQPLTPPDTYPGSLDLVTSAGNQSIGVSLVVVATVAPALVPERFVFAGVAPAAVVGASVVVRNDGNVALAVGPLPEEPLFEVRAHPRVLALAVGGAVSVEPALGLAAVGTVTFTNDTPTVAPGGWAAVAFQLTVPGGIPANAHLRALPRVATERFAVDLLTGP